MLEIHCLLRIAVLTPRYSSRYSRGPRLPRARHVGTDFPADAHQGIVSCESTLDYTTHFPLPHLHYTCLPIH